ncbi:MAG TPA: methylated-DNA--[protein]-cysteine S-methyltransferase [Acidimicrobiales bacterium]|nr:methylated-DNA--[protein]-cysteine S-methyltransferase [Acidimicrobiales bacterium]
MSTAEELTAPGPTTQLCVESPIGNLVVSGNDEFVTELLLDVPGRTVSVSGDRRNCRGPVLDAARQLDEYFARQRTTFDLPLRVCGTEFQEQVWLTLAEIPYGETISYAELARWVGRPQAFRAVGQANGANPIPVILPCHRVIAADGTIGGYGGGLSTKRVLLALESDP